MVNAMVYKKSKYLSSSGMSDTLLLCIDSNDKLFISCPNEGIISKECIKYSITKEEFSFYFLSQKYILSYYQDGFFTFKVTDIMTQTIRNIKFKEIEQEQFENMNFANDNLLELMNLDVYENQGEKIQFTYDFNDSKINAIRKYVDMETWLDSSSDFNKMYSCLSWVNDIVKHKSYVNLPLKRDAISLLTFAKNNNYKLNCRGLAILLSELCLAAGLYARYITCNLRETNIEDCHVVVIAFSKELGKWVLLDPSYCLVLYNANNIPLSLSEFRSFLIHNLDIIVNKQANYYDHKLDFNKYVKKNGKKLYRFSSPIHVSIGCDENKFNNTVDLVPSINEYVQELPKVISNERVFWQLPVLGGENE